MTKTEIEQKIAEVKAQGDALQKHNAQLMQQIEVNKVEIAKIIGKLDLLSEMLTDCEKQAAEPAKEEVKEDAGKNDKSRIQPPAWLRRRLSRGK
jgi:uncharacterized coiled-coil protein SlyX